MVREEGILWRPTGPHKEELIEGEFSYVRGEREVKGILNNERKLDLGNDCILRWVQGSFVYLGS